MPRTTRQSATGITAAVIYTRVSGDEQERQGLSLPAQLADCRRYAQQHDWIIGAEFQDLMSVKRDDRPQYLALLAEVRPLRAAGQNAVVVVKWLHRFGRRVSEGVRCWEELDALEAHDCGLTKPIDSFVRIRSTRTGGLGLLSRMSEQAGQGALSLHPEIHGSDIARSLCSA